MKNILYIGNNLQSKNSNPTYMQALGKLLETIGYSVWYTSNKNNKVLRLLDMLYQTFKGRKNIDIVLIDTYSTSNFYFALVVSQLCRLFKLKYIPILHGGNLPMRLKKYPKFSDFIFNNAFKNVSPSSYLKTAFESYGYNHLMYIPNTIEIEKYPFKERDITTIKLLWVRSFHKIYNPKLAIEVFERIQSENKNTTLCMVGPDSDGSLIEARNYAKEKQIEVIFTEKLTKKEWITLSKDYTIFLNTASFDNTPLSVIEAMALGLPIVSTNVGGMPYLISDKKEGLLVEENNSIAMADAVIYLFKNQKFAKTIAANARIKVEQFDWNIVKKYWINLLQ